jgi:hypothetical protein
MNADHGETAEVAPFLRRFFPLDLRLRFCFEVIHKNKIAGMKVIVNRG